MLSPESSVFQGNKDPEQLVNEAEQRQQQQQQQEGSRGRSGHGSGGGGLGPRGQAVLKDLMREGLGDHILLLRLYQVRGRGGGLGDSNLQCGWWSCCCLEHQVCLPVASLSSSLTAWHPEGTRV